MYRKGQLATHNPTTCRASTDKPFPWAVGFFFGDLDLSMNLWAVIAGISGFDD